MAELDNAVSAVVVVAVVVVVDGIVFWKSLLIFSFIIARSQRK